MAIDYNALMFSNRSPNMPSNVAPYISPQLQNDPPMSVQTPVYDTSIFQNPVIQKAISDYAISNGAINQQSIAPSGISKEAWDLADEDTKSRMKNLKALKDSRLLETPYQKAMREHPILMGLSNFAMGMGEGITGRPYLSNFQNNQDALQKQSMDMINDAIKSNTAQQVPLIVMGSDGKPTVVGNTVKGSIVRQSPEALLALAAAKNQLPTADMRNNLATAQQAEALISDLRSQANNLKGGYAGIGKQAEAFITRGAGDSGNYKMYDDMSKSAAVAFYRAVTGDTRLSDQDAAGRAYPLMWKTNEDESLRDKKFNFLDRMISARKSLLSSGKYSDGDVIPFDVIKRHADNMKTFTVGGVTYNIPSDRVDAFKKAKGLK